MAQRVIIDTNVFLSVMNREEPSFSPSKEFLDLVDAGEVSAVVSVITVAELSTGFHLMGDDRGRREFLLHIMSSENYKVAPVDVGVADTAGRIRAETGLRLPDSIIVSSGLRERVDLIVTHDEGFKVAGDYTEAGIPTVLCGPGSIDQGHTVDEFIAVDQLEKGVKVYKKVIEEICL